jgi:hypothetical protein
LICLVFFHASMIATGGLLCKLGVLDVLDGGPEGHQNQRLSKTTNGRK